tara:strand:+ start:11437 stop:11934 length:498 start_codon:yes stop_codon:yes gene_type:complete
MKKYIIVFIIFGFNLSSCQNLNKEKMIEKFIKDQFNDKISTDDVVDIYIEVKPDSLNKFSISDRKKIASGIIEKARNNQSDDSWLIPNYEIKFINDPRVYPYKKYKNLDKIEIGTSNKYKDRIYVLLDTKNEEILQYFLLNEDNDKILSFSLFIKSENLGYFFTY